MPAKQIILSVHLKKEGNEVKKQPNYQEYIQNAKMFVWLSKTIVALSSLPNKCENSCRLISCTVDCLFVQSQEEHEKNMKTSLI